MNRGRALSAFNRLLDARVQQFKSEGQSGESAHGQTNIQSDLQRLLAPLTETEESLLLSVRIGSQILFLFIFMDTFGIKLLYPLIYHISRSSRTFSVILWCVFVVGVLFFLIVS